MPLVTDSRFQHRAQWNRTSVALLALFLGAILLAGCSADRVAGGTSAVAPDAGQSVDRDASAGDEAIPGGVSEEAPSGGATLTEQIVRTGDVSIDVADISSAANRITSVVSAAGGEIGSDQRHGEATDGSADLVLRVPPDSFDNVLETITGLGDELSRSVSAEDVSTVVADVDARVQSLQNSVDRLLALAAQAVSVSDLIAIESELSTRQSELESLQAQQRALADQVSLATLSVRLTASSQPEGDDTGFLASLGAGWNALLDFGRGLISVVGRVLPWLALLAVIAVPLWLVVRRRRRSELPAPAAAGSVGRGAAEPTGEGITVPAVSAPTRPPE